MMDRSFEKLRDYLIFTLNKAKIKKKNQISQCIVSNFM